MRKTLAAAKKVFSCMWRVVPLALLIACFYSIPVHAATDMEAIVEANNAFALDLYREIGSSNGGGNIFFSPSSIYAALAMAYAGARGETASQMARTLHLSILQEQLHPALAEEWAALQSKQLAAANVLWG